MNNETIRFNGNKYKGRWVHLPGLGEQLISSEKLNKELIGGDDKYVSTEAEVVDSTVYCYVPDELLVLSDNEIADYIARNIS